MSTSKPAYIPLSEARHLL
uniref:Uncharacterized protein MANES_11G118300 n=1 Tax=Rhizophora mucronata TaxID=61149 RepID=A0A2P2LQM3_RHIMU